MNPTNVTDAELAVLERLWDQPPREPSTIRQITDQLYPGGSTSHYATVQKLLERLESKSCITRDSTRSPHTFAAAVSRDQLLAHRLRALADKFTGGSLTPLVTQLLQSERLTARDIEQFRALINQKSPKRRH